MATIRKRHESETQGGEARRQRGGIGEEPAKTARNLGETNFAYAGWEIEVHRRKWQPEGKIAVSVPSCSQVPFTSLPQLSSTTRFSCWRTETLPLVVSAHRGSSPKNHPTAAQQRDRKSTACLSGTQSTTRCTAASPRSKTLLVVYLVGEVLGSLHDGLQRVCARDGCDAHSREPGSRGADPSLSRAAIPVAREESKRR